MQKQSKRYVGRFQVILEILQETFLLKILKEIPQKHKTPNVFDKSIEKDKEKEDDDKEKILFKTLEERELQQAFGFFQSMAKLNMGYLPIYFMFSKLVEKFAEKLSMESLVDWLYLLGNCNRLPKELSKTISDRLAEFPRKNDQEKNLDFSIKYLWVLIIKNPEEIPREAIEFLMKQIKSIEGNVKKLGFDCKIRLFQIILLLIMQDLKVFDRYLGLSKESIEMLRGIYSDFLMNSRQTRSEHLFKEEIERFLKKAGLSYKKNVILEYEGEPAELFSWISRLLKKITRRFFS